MSREQLIEMARENLGYVKAGTTQLRPEVLRVPAANYFDAERFAHQLLTQGSDDPEVWRAYTRTLRSM